MVEGGSKFECYFCTRVKNRKGDLDVVPVKQHRRQRSVGSEKEIYSLFSVFALGTTLTVQFAKVSAKRASLG